MKLTNAQILLILAALGLSTNSALADEGAAPASDEIKLQVQTLVENGLITFEHGTNKPILNLDVLESLKKEGRIQTLTSLPGTICGGGF